MMDVNKTVREFAVEVPNATRLFEKLGIDYCCGGGKSLRDACAQANVSLPEVLEKLSAAPDASAEQGWPTASLTELINHIVATHHAYVRQEIPRIQQLIAKVLSKHGENHPELKVVAGLFAAVAAELNSHLMKEEHILFPYITQLEQQNGGPRKASCFGTVRNPIHMMELEHDSAGDTFRRLHEVTNDFTAPSDACTTFKTLYRALHEFETELHQHIHLENNILHPRAIELEERGQ